VRFSSFFSGKFITAIAVNPPERKLAKRTSVQCEIEQTQKRALFKKSLKSNYSLIKATYVTFSDCSTSREMLYITSKLLLRDYFR
jgi:hypothetical protein